MNLLLKLERDAVTGSGFGWEWITFFGGEGQVLWVGALEEVLLFLYSMQMISNYLSKDNQTMTPDAHSVISGALVVWYKRLEAAFICLPLLHQFTHTNIYVWLPCTLRA